MRVRLVTAVMIAMSGAVGAAQAPAPQTPPASPAPASPPPAPAAPASPAPAAAGPAAGRMFTAPVGLLFNTVKPERVADFERVLGYLQAALDQTTDATEREQAKGWRVFKAAEAGPGGSVLYVFVIDPAVPDADYGFGRILAHAYDTTQLQEIWKLYTGAVTSGGSLLNLVPVKPAPPSLPSSTPASGAEPSAPVERPLPPDADPNRR